MNKPRSVLVFGAGVIGAYLTHVLIKAGNNFLFWLEMIYRQLTLKER